MESVRIPFTLLFEKSAHSKKPLLVNSGRNLNRSPNPCSVSHAERMSCSPLTTQSRCVLSRCGLASVLTPDPCEWSALSLSPRTALPRTSWLGDLPSPPIRFFLLLFAPLYESKTLFFQLRRRLQVVCHGAVPTARGLPPGHSPPTHTRCSNTLNKRST